MANEHLITITPDESAWKQAAKDWKRKLLIMPVLAMASQTKFLTGLPGCTTNQYLGSAEVKAQFVPYAADKRVDSSTDIIFRELEIHFGCMNVDFVPNNYIQTLLGKGGSVRGLGQTKTDMAKLILSNIMASAGDNLAMALATAEYNANGDTTMELFDGYLTIIQKEIAAGNLTYAKGNYEELDEAMDFTNACQVIKRIEFGLDPKLRKQKRLLYCDPMVLDMYNESYQLTHTALVYNKEYDQPIVEGSRGLMTFAPIDSLAGTGMMFIAPKENVVYGYDSLSDTETFEVLRHDVDTWTAAAKMFFGVQFRTLDKRFLKVIKVNLDDNMDGDPGDNDDPAYPHPSVRPLEVELNEGETHQITLDPDDDNWDFTSSNESVATVDANGEITAVSAGTAKIFCEYTDGTVERVTVTVFEAPAGNP